MQLSLHRSSFLFMPRCDRSPPSIVRKDSIAGPCHGSSEYSIPASLPRSCTHCTTSFHCWLLLYALRYSPGVITSFQRALLCFVLRIPIIIHSKMDRRYSTHRDTAITVIIVNMGERVHNAIQLDPQWEKNLDLVTSHPLTTPPSLWPSHEGHPWCVSS